MVHILLALIYIAFVSLGLPDGLLGAAWPLMYGEFSVGISMMGPVFLIISIGTVISSLLTDRLTYRFGTGMVTAFSVAMTAASLFGFALSNAYWMLCLWAIPYGLGAGCVDASLNNYVAIHYSSRHMSWLHCMWGLGAAAGPYILGFLLTGGFGWNSGYYAIGILQAVLTAVLFVALPIWKKAADAEPTPEAEPMKLAQVLRLPGVVPVIVTFFCYCALEQTVAQWASSYLVLDRNMGENAAAALAGMFYAGLTAGRLISGFATAKLSDRQLVNLGNGIIAFSVVLMLLPLGAAGAVVSLSMMGLGCAPIYPCIIHSTPAHFGAARSQTIIGVQMAAAYVGICAVPPVFGLVIDFVGPWTLPVASLIMLAVMVWGHWRMCKVTAEQQ